MADYAEMEQAIDMACSEEELLKLISRYFFDDTIAMNDELIENAINRLAMLRGVPIEKQRQETANSVLYRLLAENNEGSVNRT